MSDGLCGMRGVWCGERSVSGRKSQSTVHSGQRRRCWRVGRSSSVLCRKCFVNGLTVRATAGSQGGIRSAWTGATCPSRNRVIPSAPNRHAGGGGFESARLVQVDESAHAHWKCRSRVAGNLFNSPECRPEKFPSPSSRTPTAVGDLFEKSVTDSTEILNQVQDDEPSVGIFRDDKVVLASTLNSHWNLAPGIRLPPATADQAPARPRTRRRPPRRRRPSRIPPCRAPTPPPRQ